MSFKIRCEKIKTEKRGMFLSLIEPNYHFEKLLDNHKQQILNKRFA